MTLPTSSPLSHPALTAHRRTQARRRLVLASLAVACLAALMLDVMTGPSSLAPERIVAGLFDPGRLSAPEAAIVWSIRLPAALMAVMVGAALALSGAEMQTVLADGGPGATLGFLFRNAPLLVTGRDMVGLALLLVRLGRLVSAWHERLLSCGRKSSMQAEVSA